MTDNRQPPDGGNVPPKIDLRKSGLIPGADAPGGVSPKKQTTRIDIDAAVAPAPQAPGPSKTIRIKRPVPVEPMDGAPVTPPYSVAMEAEKKKTSRIPLDAALAVSGAIEEGGVPGIPGAPKTIRIKRPGQASTIKLTRPGAAAEPVPSEEGLKSQTSRIDLPLAAPEAATIATQRKTIKIRRPEGGLAPSGRKIQIARPGEEAAAAVAPGAVPLELAVTEERFPAVFPILAIASVLAACVLVYVLAVQAFNLNLPFPAML